MPSGVATSTCVVRPRPPFATLGPMPWMPSRTLSSPCATPIWKPAHMPPLRSADYAPAPRAPHLAIDVLLKFLKDETIQICDNKKTSVGGTGQETITGKANVKEVGKGDGRTMAIQALDAIGGRRVAQRRDIVQQLQKLAN